MAEQLVTGITCNDNATPVLERFKRTVSEVSGSSIGAFATMGLVAGGVAKGIDLIGTAIAKSLGPSMEMEKLQVQFKVLLGSTGEAKKRMEELAKFSDTTPFELSEVAKASKTLETLTRGALSTGKGLTLVGDAAAASGVPFDELSVHIGRLYDGLDSGRPVGESLSRLQELGLISGETRGEIEKLQKEGKKGPEVWGVAEKALGQYSGMMAEQANTMEGLASTMQDSLSGVLREFGNALLPDAKTATKELTETLNDLKPAAEVVGFVVGSVVKLFNVALIGLKAFATVAIPAALGGLGLALTKALQTCIGWAQKVNSIFGSLLPASMSKGLTDGLQSASEWADGMSSYFGTVVDEAGKTGEGLTDKLVGIYQTPDEVDDSGTGKKKKGKTKGSGAGDNKGKSKETEDAIKALEQITKEHQKADQEIKKIRNQMVLDSIKDEREKEFEALGQRVKQEQDSANGNVELLKAIQAKYRQDVALLNEKYNKIELEDKLKSLNKQIEAEEKRQAKIDEDRKKSEEAYKEMLEREKAVTQQFAQTLNQVLGQPFERLTKTMGTWVTSMGKHGKSMKDTFRSVWSDIQDNFGNALAKMLTDWVMNKMAMYAKDLAMKSSYLASSLGLSASANAASVAQAEATGAATTQAMAPAAATSSVASWGTAAVIGGAALAAVMAMAMSYHASGTSYAYGGPSVVGERGPEIVNLPRGSEVIPNDKIVASGGDSINLTFNNSGITAREITRELSIYQKKNSRQRRGA